MDFLMGFFFALLIVCISLYLVKRDIKKKRLEINKKLGIDVNGLMNSLNSASDSPKDIDIVK